MPQALAAGGATVCTNARGSGAAGRHHLHHGARHARCARRCCSAEYGVAAGPGERQDRGRLSSIDPIATKGFAKHIAALGLRLPRCAGIGRRSRRQGGQPDHHGAAATQAAFERVQPLLDADGQEHHAGRRGVATARSARSPTRSSSRSTSRRSAKRWCSPPRPAPTRPRCARR